MIEVFRTNVKDHTSSARILALIKINHPHYAANFDLDDCDCVLRIECTTQGIDAIAIIGLLQNAGFNAAVLEDIVLS